MILSQIVIFCSVSALMLGLYVTLLKELVPRNLGISALNPMLVGFGAACVLLVIMLSMRSLNFGVDTVAYAELFSHYCNGAGAHDIEYDFYAATLLLNALMFSSCNTSLLPAAWTVAIVLPILLLPVQWRLRICFLAVFLLSIVGIELATNALRQGLSGGFILLSVSILMTQAGFSRWLALPFALIALMFHISAALVLIAYILARLPWHLFLFISTVIILLIIESLDNGVAVPLASEFIYEIQKYAAHDNDEIWIRTLAFTTVLASLSAPLLTRNNVLPRISIFNGQYAIAVRLACLCIPGLVLPYFGYRFIYGVYPVILFLTVTASMPSRIHSLGRTYKNLLLLLCMNVFVLLVWSAGSSYMREVSFL